MNNTYLKGRKSFAKIRHKFEVKFPNRSVPFAETIRRLAKRFKGTCSVNNRKSKRKRSVLTEQKLVRKIWKGINQTKMEGGGQSGTYLRQTIGVVGSAGILLQTKNTVFFVRKLHMYIFLVSFLRLTMLTCGPDDTDRQSLVTAALSPPSTFVWLIPFQVFLIMLYSLCLGDAHLRAWRRYHLS